MEAVTDPNQISTAEAIDDDEDLQQKLTKGKSPQRQEKLRLKQQRKRQAQRKAKWAKERTDSPSLDQNEEASKDGGPTHSSGQSLAGGMSHGSLPMGSFITIKDLETLRVLDASNQPASQTSKGSREYVLNALWYTYFYGWSHNKVCKGFTPDLMLRDTPVPQFDGAFMKAFTSLRRIVFNGSHDPCPSQTLFTGAVKPSIVDERIPYFDDSTDYTCKIQLFVASESKLIDAQICVCMSGPQHCGT